MKNWKSKIYAYRWILSVNGGDYDVCILFKGQRLRFSCGIQEFTYQLEAAPLL